MYEQTMNNDVTLTGGEKPLLAGRYQVVRQLGHGGMGSVWLAEDTFLDNKQFAIKMLPSILVANKMAYRQLKDEALVAMKLVHPNIVQIRAFEENNGNPFLVMDYIDGQTLDDYIADKGALSEDEIVRLLKPVAEALDYAHGEGVVHRDVKPANVMIRKDGRPFVLDFGIAREVQESMTRVTGKMSSGTLMYMSPEQLSGAPPSPAQDVYSFAVMVYECLNGTPPFVRGQIKHQILNTPPPPLPSGIASWLSSATMCGLAKKSNERPSTCCEIFGISASRVPLYSNNVHGGAASSATQQAIQAYKEEEFAKAFSLAQNADKSNAEIQFIIGWCYRYGQGVEANSKVATKWLRKAAEQGNSDAQYEYGKSLAVLFDDRLRKTEEREGVDWLRKASNDGYAEAQYYLGYYLLWYHDTREDISDSISVEGIRWLRQAAEQDHVKAQELLAYSYWAGDGVEANDTEAAKWYRAAAEQGIEEAKKGLKELDGEKTNNP